MSHRGEVLVAIINNQADFALAMDKHWYRVPVSSQEKWLKDRWPPKWLALYQTKKLGLEAFAINYYAEVHSIRQAFRWQLFPEQPRNEKSNRTLLSTAAWAVAQTTQAHLQSQASPSHLHSNDVGKVQ